MSKRMEEAEKELEEHKSDQKAINAGKSKKEHTFKNIMSLKLKKKRFPFIFINSLRKENIKHLEQ